MKDLEHEGLIYSTDDVYVLFQEVFDVGLRDGAFLESFVDVLNRLVEDVSEDTIINGILFIVEFLELGCVAIEELQGTTQVFCEGRRREELAGESLFEGIHHLRSLSDRLWLVEDGLLSGLKGAERDVVLRFG